MKISKEEARDTHEKLEKLLKKVHNQSGIEAGLACVTPEDIDMLDHVLDFLDRVEGTLPSQAAIERDRARKRKPAEEKV